MCGSEYRFSQITVVITQHEKQTYYKQATCRVFGFITLLFEALRGLLALQSSGSGSVRVLNRLKHSGGWATLNYDLP